MHKPRLAQFVRAWLLLGALALTACGGSSRVLVVSATPAPLAQAPEQPTATPFPTAFALFAPSITPGGSVSPPPAYTPYPSHTPIFVPSSTPVIELASLTPVPTFTPVAVTFATAAPAETATASPTLFTSPTPYPTLTPWGGTVSGYTGTPMFTAPLITTPWPETAPNLLFNGGFEAGSPIPVAEGVNCPPGWQCFWHEGPALHDPANEVGFSRPFMDVHPNQPPWDDPPRIYEGSLAAMIAGNCTIFDGGWYQRLAIAPNVRVQFGGWGQSWSSYSGSDPYHSEIDNTDALINVGIWLGLDPTGGVNPYADTVVWGPLARNYDSYGPLGAVEVVSYSGAITAFVRVSTLWPFCYLQGWIDGLWLRAGP